MALRAGTYVAPADTREMKITTAAKVLGSVVETPNMSPERNRVRKAAPTTPRVIPTSDCVIPWRSYTDPKALTLSDLESHSWTPSAFVRTHPRCSAALRAAISVMGLRWTVYRGLARFCLGRFVDAPQGFLFLK